MDLIDIKDRINRIRFFFEKIKYGRSKHFYLSVIGLILVLIVLFLVIFFNQSLEIKRKDNILKSYYSKEELPERSGPGGEEGQDQAEENAGSIEDSTFVAGSQEGREDPDNTGDLIKAYICGEVARAAVYEIENGKRISDLLDMAGGASEDAYLVAVNLAQKVIDGQRIYIPSREEVESGRYILPMQESSPAGGTGDVFSNMAVNINSAGPGELQSLPGIGPVTAQYIIDYRNKRGPFNSKEELKNVTGIGEKKYEKIKDAISI